MCQAHLLQTIENGHGRTGDMSSVSAQQGAGVSSKTPCSAARAGILGQTRSVPREMAERGITVDAVSARVVATNIGPAPTGPEAAPHRQATRLPGAPDRLAH